MSCPPCVGFKLVGSSEKDGETSHNSSGTSMSGVRITCTPCPRSFPVYYPAIAIAACVCMLASIWPRNHSRGGA